MQRMSRVFLAVLLLIGLVLFLGKKKAKSPTHNQVAEVVKASPKKAVKSLKAAAGPVAASNDNTSREQRDSKAGFRDIGYTIDDHGQNRLKVTVKTMSVCYPADYDAMAAAVGNDGQILLSLEPFGEAAMSGVQPATKLLALRDIYNEVTVDLPVANEKGSLFGLFLCSDAAKAGRCGGKKPANFNAIIGGSNDPAKGDAMFYFQFAVLKPKSAMVYGGSDRSLPGAREDLADQSLGGGALEEDIRKVATLMREVKSLPPVSAAAGENTAIAVQVAMLDSAKCGGRR